jgi:hypothetical protein
MNKEKSTARIFRGKGDTHPHACLDGLVYLTYTAHDEEVGAEVEKIEVIPCRRCVQEWACDSVLQQY